MERLTTWYRPRHRTTDPACRRHRPPRTRLGRWRFDRNRGRSWCGAGFVYLAATEPTAHGGIGVDEVPDGEPACGPCVGKALGAGQDGLPVGAGLPQLRYDPRWIKPPTVCSGSGRDTWEDVPNSRNIVRCLVCGLLVAGRAQGSPYNPSWGPVRHAPGPDMAAPCPFHAWNNLTMTPAGVACACGYPPAGPPPEGNTP